MRKVRKEHLETLRSDGGILRILRVEEEDELVLDARIVENLARELIMSDGGNACLPIVVVDEKREVVPVDEIRDVIVVGDIAGKEDGHIIIDVMVGDERVGIGGELGEREK